MVQKLSNVVFGGTGVRNPAYVGALLALEDQGLYEGITGFAGTSAGAIVVALAGVGYSPREVLRHIMELDFRRIPGGNPLLAPLRLVTRFGWFDADYLTEQLGTLIAAKVGDASASIDACERVSGKRIRIVATNLSTRETRVFPDPSASYLSLVEAVRTSMSIPLFFTAPRIDGDLYVDGGVLWNTPVEVFDSDRSVNLETVGMVVTEPRDRQPQRIRWPREYGLSLLRTLVRGQDAAIDDNPTTRSRVIKVDDLGISPVDFFITRPQKWALVDAGRVAMNAFLEERRERTVRDRGGRRQVEAGT